MDIHHVGECEQRDEEYKVAIDTIVEQQKYIKRLEAVVDQVREIDLAALIFIIKDLEDFRDTTNDCKRIKLGD